MEQQLHSRWCWAAVAVSVARFYDAGTSWTQCRLADMELGRSDCCGAGGKGPCNVAGFLHTSLARVGHLDYWTGAAASFATVRVEVDQGNPFCARIAWNQGGAHFVAIFGYTEGGVTADAGLVSVADPWYGNSDVAYTEFRERYRGSGTWTHSYICQRE
ncbi:Papain-like cysteine protease AvrRpt2 [bacterium JGI 053]|nr:Papain-like cysteine protease AvrRpt2 [bacterium JGI 053]